MLNNSTSDIPRAKISLIISIYEVFEIVVMALIGRPPHLRDQIFQEDYFILNWAIQL